MDKAMERIGEERLVRVTVGPMTLEGNLSLPEGPVGSCCSLTAVGVAGTAPAIAMWHGCSTRQSWRPC
jgi:hypothetical protein